MERFQAFILTLMHKRIHLPLPATFLLVSILMISSCRMSRQAFDPARKFPAEALKTDFTIFRGVLEEYHPGLYWFSPREHMDRLFDEGYASLRDSLDEIQFLNKLSYIASDIRCGHTYLRRSKLFTRYLDTAAASVFPLNVKVWPDSMAVTSNLFRNDSLLRAGTVITGINGRSIREWNDTFFHHLFSDGFSLSGKYQSLSNTGGFGSMYRRLYGNAAVFSVRFRDSTGSLREARLPAYQRNSPGRDTTERRGAPHEGTIKRNKLNPLRHLTIDTTGETAILTLNTFAQGNSLRSFFRKSFRRIHQNKIAHLVIDVRGNGGGDAGLAILLARYLASKPFRVADSLYAKRVSGNYDRYIDHHFLYRIGIRVVTRKGEDGYRHFRYFERHVFSPLKKNAFRGDIYLVIGGNSFSATTVFVKMLQGEKNVTVVGEETGGGSYGNSAWMLPQVTLPHTGIRLTLPLFRMVMDKEAARYGRGILPDVPAGATPESIRKNEDPKMRAVFSLILHRKKVDTRESAY